MLYVALAKQLPANRQERMKSRLEWQVPEVGVKVLGEYWLQAPDPAVVAVFEADSTGQIMAAFSGWHEFFDISVYPAIEASEGIELLKRMLES